MYSTPNLFDHHNSYYRNTDNNHSERSLYESQYSFTTPNPNLTSRETGTPIFGRYAQDGFWDDESDTTTIRQRGSSSTSHTIMTKSPASSGHRAPSTKGGDHYSRSVTPAGAGGGSSGHGAMPSPGLTPDQWGKEEDKVDRGLFSWAKRPSVANLQAVMHGHPIDEHHHKDTPPPPVPTKKKSFGMLKGMGRRGELTVSVDPADESVSPCSKLILEVILTCAPSLRPDPYLLPLPLATRNVQFCKHRQKTHSDCLLRRRPCSRWSKPLRNPRPK